MDGTTFQCVLPSDDGLAVEESDIGVLTVMESNGKLIIIDQNFNSR